MPGRAPQRVHHWPGRDASRLRVCWFATSPLPVGCTVHPLALPAVIARPAAVDRGAPAALAAQPRRSCRVAAQVEDPRALTAAATVRRGPLALSLGAALVTGHPIIPSCGH